MQRGLEIKRVLALNQGTSLAVDSREAAAFKDFLSGLNLEAAGQYEQAVITLLGTLRSGVPELPASLIGEHLSAIEKAHPREFAEGKDRVLNPPAQAYPGGPYEPFGPRGGAFDPRTGQFRPPGMPEPTP